MDAIRRHLNPVQMFVFLLFKIYFIIFPLLRLYISSGTLFKFPNKRLYDFSQKSAP